MGAIESRGAPRIHGELLKPGIDVGQTSVAKYMVRRRGRAAPDYVMSDRDCAYGEAYVGGFARWAFATDQRHRDRHGRTPMLNG